MGRDPLKRRDPDDGFALVVALLVTLISFVVVTGVLAQAIHNVVQSGYGRRRLAAISAAEGGLNWYANQLSTSNLIALSSAGLGWVVPNAATCQTATLPTSCWYSYPKAGFGNASTATSPEAATFEIRVLYTTQNPCQVPDTSPATSAQCGMANLPTRGSTIGWPSVAAASQKTGVLLLADTEAQPFPDPVYAIVRSVGTAGGVQRTLESYVRLRAVRGGVEGGIAAISMCLGSGATVNVEGDLAVNNQAVGGTRPTAFNESTNCPVTYSTGDLVVGSGNSLDIKATGTAGGSLTIRGGGLVVDGNSPFKVARDVWAEGTIKIGCSGGTCTNTLSACPNSGTIQCVGDDAVGASIALGPYAFVAGDTIVCDPACPPPAVFPELKWREADWTSTGWTVVHLSSSTGLTDRISGANVPTVFRLDAGASPCDLQFTGLTLTLQTRVAVVSECRFIFNKAGATLSASNPTGSLMLINAAPDAGAAAANCGTQTASPYGPRDASIENNQHFDAPLFIYTPCILWIKGNQSQGNEDVVQGQFVARFMIIKNAVRLVQVNIADYVTTIPGQIFRFNQDVKFVREIRTSLALANGIL